jgi:hypothetical protein
MCPCFEDFLAAHFGEPCALQVATREYQAALLAFHQWEAARLREVTPSVPR